MGEIRILSEDLANRIAAGEVVERPASIVKELVENALDADATRVDVAVAQGGIRWIAVTDDGTGLDAADAPLAFRRHATSKIRTAEELAHVATLGFRGEALPSILSVARVRMRTRRRGASAGVELVGEGEGIGEVRPVGCPIGTRIEVAELFARVPARRKFLKSPVTESGHVLRWLERAALARPDIHFTLERDGRPLLQLPATSSVRERVIAVVPPSFGDRLLAVEMEGGSAGASGFASPAAVNRGSPSDVYLFVNGRPVRDRLLMQAVRDSYREALPPGRHPVVVLFLKVDPEEVDVNVHPAKWEVRFRDPGAIHRLVRATLAQAIDPRRVFAPGPASPRVWEPAEGRPHGAVPPPDLLLDRGPWGGEPGETPTGSRVAEASGERRPPVTFAALRYVGAALGTYLLLEGDGALVILDQHAAHERVLYERLRDAWFGGKVERQALLVPTRVELPRSAAEALLERAGELSAAGFEVEGGEPGVRGGLVVSLRTVPAVLAERPPSAGWVPLLEETGSALRSAEPGDAREGLEAGVHRALATAACHAAFRKGDRVDPREVRALLEALDESVWVPSCPHGRPLVALVDETEISRRFLRG